MTPPAGYRPLPRGVRSRLHPTDSRVGIVNWGAACGRVYLRVGRFILATQGDINRGDGTEWTAEDIEQAAEEIASEIGQTAPLPRFVRYAILLCALLSLGLVAVKWPLVALVLLCALLFVTGLEALAEVRSE